MGDRECNYCVYQNILSRARQNNEVVRTSKPIDGGVSDVTIYVNDKFVSWFLYLPDHCKC